MKALIFDRQLQVKLHFINCETVKNSKAILPTSFSFLSVIKSYNKTDEMFKKKKQNSSTTAGWETNRIIHSSGFRVKLSAEEGKRRESDISQRLVTRSLTCFCCAFTVQHLQDVFGDFLDGVPRLVSQFAHAVQNHQPLVALMAGALLLRERRTNKCKWEVIPKWTLTDVRPYSTAGVGANTIHFQGGFIIKSTLRSCSNTEPPHLWNGKVSGVLNVPWLFVQLRKSWVQAFVFTARLVVLVQSWFLRRRTALRLAVHGRGKHLHGTKVTKKKKKKRK